MTIVSKPDCWNACTPIFVNTLLPSNVTDVNDEHDKNAKVLITLVLAGMIIESKPDSWNALLPILVNTLLASNVTFVNEAQPMKARGGTLVQVFGISTRPLLGAIRHWFTGVPENALILILVNTLFASNVTDVNEKH